MKNVYIAITVAVILAVSLLVYLVWFASDNGVTDVSERSSEGYVCGDTVQYNGDAYSTIQIGDNCWFAENLRSDSYSDGVNMTSVAVEGQWEGVEGGAYSYPFFRADEGDFLSDRNSVVELIEGLSEEEAMSALDMTKDEAMEANMSKQELIDSLGIYNYLAGIHTIEDAVELYGYLYNSEAVMSDRDLCPNGWRVSTADDWSDLEDALVAHELYSGDNIGSMLAGSRVHWTPGALRSDDGFGVSGFDAVPAGVRDIDGYILNAGTAFWVIDQDGSTNRTITYGGTSIDMDPYPESSAYSVRCVM